MAADDALRTGTRAYWFGDTEPAVQRLGLLHMIFAPNSAAFLRDLALPSPRLAIDLGCGPGATTRMLRDVTRATRVVGLELSPALLALAQAAAPPACAFRRHDVTATPFPDRPADLIYGRFLLTHLGDVAAWISQWAGELAPGGTLVLEETEAIATDVPVFTRYIAVVEGMLAAEGQVLCPGPVIGRLPAFPALRLRTGRIRPVPVANRQAATLFRLNLASWRDQPLVRTVATDRQVEELAAGLEAIIAAGDERAGITWRIRQVAYERTGG